MSAAPTEEQRKAVHLFGWTVCGWGPIAGDQTRSNTLLKVLGADGHNPRDLLSVPTLAPIEDWIWAMHERNHGRY